MGGEGGACCRGTTVSATTTLWGPLKGWAGSIRSALIPLEGQESILPFFVGKLEVLLKGLLKVFGTIECHRGGSHWGARGGSLQSWPWEENGPGLQLRGESCALEAVWKQEGTHLTAGKRAKSRKA